jgi:hypothetical protein
VDGFRIAEPAALGNPHGVDVANQVRNGSVGGGEFFDVAFRAVAPRHTEPVPFGERAGPRLLGDGFVRMLVQFRPLDRRRPLVEQPDQGAQKPRLALSTLAEQDDVVARDQGPLKLGQDGPAETIQAGPGITVSC